MTDQEILKIFLETQEWHTFECKRAAVQPAKLLNTVVAFANTEGGFLVIGLEDPQKAKNSKRLIGISENLDNVSEFLKLIEKEITPPLKVWNKFNIEITNIKGENDKLLIIHISKSNDIHSLRKGDTFIRRGRQNVKLTAEEIIRLKYEKGSLKIEDEVSNIDDLEGLNRNLLNEYKQDTKSQEENDWQFLKDNGLAIKQKDRFYLNNAGVLLFAKNPTVLLARKCGIKISRYYGTKISYTGEPNFVHRPISIEGPLISQIKQAIEYFRNAVRNSPPKLTGASFIPSLLIPEWVFQEAITNAVIHRNYSIQNDVQIRFFDDRIEIESPGTYPGHITTANIRTERFSRNPVILRTLNRFREAPNLDIGEGVDRMFNVMREKNLYEPLYLPPKFHPHSVLLILFNLQQVEYWDVVNKYLEEHYRITNSVARKITGIKDTLRMSRLLKSWVDKGLLEKVGKGFKGNIYYKKVGIEIPCKLSSTFSKVIENEKKNSRYFP